MNKVLKAKWVKALRSGKYKQGTRWLQANERFCCLGVLCELLEIPAVPAPTEIWYNEGVFMYDDANGTPSLPTQEKMGLTEDQVRTLWHMNDGQGKYHPHTFQEIADYIEVNL